MAISAYPRTAVQGTGAGTNKQNGLSLMLLNSTTGEYEAATSSTFAGGGGGGDATAANQTTQIGLETSINDRLFEPTSGFSAAQLLGFIANLLTSTNNELGQIRNELISLNTAIVDGSQRVVIQSANGNTVDVDGATKSLNTNVAAGA